MGVCLIKSLLTSPYSNSVKILIEFAPEWFNVRLQQMFLNTFFLLISKYQEECGTALLPFLLAICTLCPVFFKCDDFFQRRCWTIILLFNSILDFYLIYFDYHLRKKVCGCNCAFLKILKSSSIALHFFWNLSKIFCSRCKLTFSLQTITPNSPTRHDIPEFCIQGRITRTHILSLSPLLSHKYTLSNHSLSHTYITQTHQCTNSFSQTLSPYHKHKFSTPLSLLLFWLS